MTRSESERVIEYNGKIAVEVATRGFVTVIFEETIGDALMESFSVQHERIKTPIRNIVEGALIGIVEEGSLDIIRCITWITWPNSLIYGRPDETGYKQYVLYFANRGVC